MSQLRLNPHYQDYLNETRQQQQTSQASQDKPIRKIPRKYALKSAKTPPKRLLSIQGSPDLPKPIPGSRLAKKTAKSPPRRPKVTPSELEEEAQFLIAKQEAYEESQKEVNKPFKNDLVIVLPDFSDDELWDKEYEKTLERQFEKLGVSSEIDSSIDSLDFSRFTMKTTVKKTAYKPFEKDDDDGYIRRPLKNTLSTKASPATSDKSLVSLLDAIPEAPPLLEVSFLSQPSRYNYDDLERKKVDSLMKTLHYIPRGENLPTNNFNIPSPEEKGHFLRCLSNLCGNCVKYFHKYYTGYTQPEVFVPTPLYPVYQAPLLPSAASTFSPMLSNTLPSIPRFSSRPPLQDFTLVPRYYQPSDFKFLDPYGPSRK